MHWLTINFFLPSGFFKPSLAPKIQLMSTIFNFIGKMLNSLLDKINGSWIIQLRSRDKDFLTAILSATTIFRKLNFTWLNDIEFEQFGGYGSKAVPMVQFTKISASKIRRRTKLFIVFFSQCKFEKLMEDKNEIGKHFHKTAVFRWYC